MRSFHTAALLLLLCGCNNHISQKDSLGIWLAANKCTSPPELDKGPGGARRVYQCASGAEVRVYTLDNLAHRWPAKLEQRENIDVIWDFFKRFPAD